MEILLFKQTKDSELEIGLQVCYQSINGAYNQLGEITAVIVNSGATLYLINTSMGAYMANELKLIKL